MNRLRPIRSARMTLRAAGLWLLLCSALVCTPQTIGWLCNTSWVELGFKAPPLLEEEVVKHSERFCDHGCALEEAVHGLVLRLPLSSDERIIAGPLAKVSVPPPKVC